MMRREATARSAQTLASRRLDSIRAAELAGAAALGKPQAVNACTCLDDSGGRISVLSWLSVQLIRVGPARRMGPPARTPDGTLAVRCAATPSQPARKACAKLFHAMACAELASRSAAARGCQPFEAGRRWAGFCSQRPRSAATGATWPSTCSSESRDPSSESRDPPRARPNLGQDPAYRLDSCAAALRAGTARRTSGPRPRGRLGRRLQQHLPPLPPRLSSLRRGGLRCGCRSGSTRPQLREIARRRAGGERLP
jgi:hypothetical protein